MRHHPLSTWQKATALVPLALLSGAWTTSLTVGFGTASATADRPGDLPDGSSLPAETVEVPASLSAPDSVVPGVGRGGADAVVAGASAHGIPSAALSAYQRAAEVIGKADPSCNLSWQLVGAIGRVESDHGRFGGSTLDDAGVAAPAILGVPLDGSGGTQRITDTDGGRYDDDPVLDRAVGPMQFIPSTWAVVGVDGDGDGVRNPQDIDDAALATAVYLCSGGEDLSTEAGQRAAVYRYNHSNAYVDLVLGVMRAYADGDYAAVPNGTAAATTFTPGSSGTVAAGERGKRGDAGKARGAKSGPGAGSGGSGTGSGSPSGGGTGGEAPAAPPGGGGPGGGGGTDDPVGTVKKKVDDATKPAPKPDPEPAEDVISGGSEAASFCTKEIGGMLDQLPPTVDPDTVVSKCAGKIAGMTESQAKATIPDSVPALLAWLGL